jgi:hypothetical protein
VDPSGDGGGALTATGLLCGSCGAQSSPTAKFCSDCGTPLTQATQSAEYKQVTVLFADVVAFDGHRRNGGQRTAARAAAVLAVPFAAVVIASPASAAPCTPPANAANSQACVNCIIAAGTDGAANSACVTGAVVTPGSTGYADCDAYQLPENRADCYDQHVMGQR